LRIKHESGAPKVLRAAALPCLHNVITLMPVIRTQIQLTESQARKIRRVASERNISFAEVVRECIDQALDRSLTLADRYKRARRIIGSVRDRQGKSDIARHHDRYLEQAFR
jgi:hypothetical protein